MIRGDWSTMKKLMVLKGMTGAPPVEDTATGNPLKFTTDLAKPLRSLLIPFSPRQSGSGDPSPENIRPIVAWDGLKVWNGGKNIIDKTQLTDGKVWWNGRTVDGYSTNCVTGKIPVKGGATFFRQGRTGNQNAVSFFDADQEFLSQAVCQPGNAYTIPINACFAGFSFGKEYKDEAMIFYGNTASAYEPYEPITETDISFPSPVYGGTLDVVAGVLTVLWKRVLLKGEPSGVSSTYQGSLYYNQNILSDADFEKEFVCNRLKYVGYTTTNFAYGTCINNGRSSFNLWVRETVFADKAEAEAWLADNDTEICYQLKTPQEITLTPEQITALKGNNTIWSDANGSMTAIYLKKK